MNDPKASPVTIIKNGAPWWMPWLAFFFGAWVGAVVALACVVLSAPSP